MAATCGFKGQEAARWAVLRRRDPRGCVDCLRIADRLTPGESHSFLAFQTAEQGPLGGSLGRQID